MHIPEFVYIDPTTLKTSDEIIDEIDRCLKFFQETAASITDEEARSEEIKSWLDNHISWIKMFFEELERRVRYG